MIVAIMGYLVGTINIETLSDKPYHMVPTRSRSRSHQATGQHAHVLAGLQLKCDPA